MRPRLREPDRYGLDSAVDDIVSLCKAMGLGAQRLRGPDTARLLWRCVNPDSTPPDDLFATEDLAQALAPGDWQETFDDVRSGSIWTRSLYIIEPPDLTSPGWLDDLVSLDATVRLSWHLRGRDRDRERARQLRRRKTFAGLARGQLQRGLADLDTEGAGDEATVLAEDLLQAAIGIVSSTLIVTLQARDRASLDKMTSQAQRIIRTRLAAPLGRGRGHQRALWRASLPFGVDVSGRACRWHTTSIGNGLPFLAHSPGMPRGYPLGFTSRGGELVTIDLSDPSLPNWVITVLGRQGSGKTFLTQLLALLTLYQAGRVTVIDRAGHYRTLIDLQGGAYIAVGKEAQPRTFNLWDIRPGEDMRAKIEMVLAAHEIMLTRPGEALDPRAEAALERAIRHVYTQHQARQAAGDDDCPRFPLERDLVAYLAEASTGSGPDRGRAGPAADDARHAACPTWERDATRIWWIVPPRWTWRQSCCVSTWRSCRRSSMP